MVAIIIYFPLTVQQYAKNEGHHNCPRPKICPTCAVVGRMTGHGWYWRKPKGVSFSEKVGVRRWRCQSCKGTMSCLPHFLLPYRHYVVAVVSKIIVRWLEQGESWSELVAAYGADGTPAVRTMQRWLKAFAAGAPLWLAKIWQEMTNQWPHHPWLEARGPTSMATTESQGAPTSAEQQLLMVAIDWLAWGQSQWAQLRDFGVADRLAFLHIWGSDRGLDRLL